ncbi:hypothetical protein EDC01DRAFT_619065 [Geopyxis carbonaria]|nr:hypothetical protein EDC01DRAFT_619065 [Geopyxis carbonaria]
MTFSFDTLESPSGPSKSTSDAFHKRRSPYEDDDCFQDDFDEETIAAIIAIQLQDLADELKSVNRKGKQREDAAPSESEIALQGIQQCLRDEERALADARLARSIDAAMETDLKILQQEQEWEAQAASDREMALRLERGQSIPVTGRAPAGRPGPSGVKKEESKLVKEATCCSCLEKRFCVSAPCGDTYCHACLKVVFLSVMKDEGLFPPRCCRKEIPLFSVAPFLSAAETTAFKAKKEELSSAYRVYCSDPACSSFIGPKNIDDGCARCPKCAELTCQSCKQAYHGKTDCANDEELLRTLETAAKQGWQRCTNCLAVVELTDGCRHITCKCTFQFCYRCGEKWKTCKCSDWDELQLGRRAEQLAIRERPANEAPSRTANRLRQIRNELRDNHLCDHTSGWTRVNGGGECEMCMDYLREYILRCTVCRVQSCHRCSRNRI